jgi:hypothetical protein
LRWHGAFVVHVVLHRADLNEGDVQDAHGVKVTRPLRTILDVLETGLVDKTQIGQAIEEALRRGLIRKQQIDSLPHDKLQDSFRELAGQRL